MPFSCGEILKLFMRELTMVVQPKSEKNNEEQIQMCFRAYRDKNWETMFD